MGRDGKRATGPLLPLGADCSLLEKRVRARETRRLVDMTFLLQETARLLCFTFLRNSDFLCHPAILRLDCGESRSGFEAGYSTWTSAGDTEQSPHVP